jgi:succinoglycan biosynthesis protein ExoV
MQLRYCHIADGNFGDDLNLLLWPRIFPDLLDGDDTVRFYGIGTLLDGRHDAGVDKVVLGSGLGEPDTAQPGPSWDFRWVRGPMSAREFGLSPDLAVGDPAILWGGIEQARAQRNPAGPIGLIPHFRTWDSFDWVRLAASVGMVAINPHLAPLEVAGAIAGCSSLMAESLHGGILADSIGVPWAPAVLGHRFNTFKWRDWLGSIGRPFQPFVADRPLVRSLSPIKSMGNRLARRINYLKETRNPQLRPVAVATAEDADRVAADLLGFSQQGQLFSHSPTGQVQQQRDRMLVRCAEFARDYGLRLGV